MPTITAANTKLTITVKNVGGAAIVGPFTCVGYAADDAFASEAVESAIVQMGVDGRMSAGRVPFITPMPIVFQADSPSIELFDAWLGAQNVLGDLLEANGILAYPGLQKGYAMVRGILTRVTPFPQAKRVLQPVNYEISWETVQPSPLTV